MIGDKTLYTCIFVGCSKKIYNIFNRVREYKQMCLHFQFLLKLDEFIV